MASSYPHKQTVIVTIICALAVAGTATYAQWSAPEKKSAQVVDISPSSTVTQDTSSSDSWKSQFFITGTSSTPTVRTATLAQATPEQLLTLTDEIGRGFFSDYLQLKQGNLTADEKAVQNAVNQTLDKAVVGASQPTFYSATNIKISPTEDAASIRAYANAVGTVFNLYGPRADAANIMSSAFETNNMTLLAQIDPIIAAYQKTIPALLQISVPAPLAEMHLALLNALSSMQYVSEGLRKADKDPMQSLVALGTYATAQDMLGKAFLGMKTYFNSHSIFFSGSEAGIMFLSLPS